MDINVYNTYGKYLKDRYGEKVYKLPISLPLTCPNRDGTVSKGGCSFCGEEGGSFENLPNCLSVKEQIQKNMKYIKERYKAKKFIAYFQNFSNTYLPIEDFKRYINESIIDDIVGISISTRPDCINDNYLNFLVDLKYNMGIDVIIELGLQSVNYHSLVKINRGHTLAEFIDAVLRIKKHDLRVCTHIILNLPWDNMLDAKENAKIVSALGIDEVKLHSLYIVEGTKMGEQYKNGEIEIISKEEYINRVISFLEYLDPNIVVQRIMGRAPEENTLFVNWHESWWKIRDEIVAKMESEKRYQGSKFNYLNGKALKNFK
ncbi:TIGR01212 family radical SAM protein [Tissierella sp. Yu-01]|uniref:TIGR01212 family radical SAM protein n=1 Tax=Tissierella sp. Yu-01 TaxID=3035694 RepID=UPI00240DFBA0|nr:TIGR01212 family radical SAM protein [Tissierella sp. Yu-01]WFA09393.1 TIGR01212 family radical SAM protein [Tissierella sp. Yu-01]